MDSQSDYSKIEELLEAKRLYTELQDKFRFEIESREARVKELTENKTELEAKLQQAFKQLDRLLKEKEQMAQEKDKVRELYEKKMQQMRKQFQERLNAGRK